MRIPRGANLLLLVVIATGCLAAGLLAYKPDALRAELATRVHSIPPGELIVPFEVDREDVARAEGVVGRYKPSSERARALIDALFDPAVFGLRYTLGRTTTARQALRQHEGNCLALASAFIGLARGLGMRAYYLDASERVGETHSTEDFIVEMGHVTAVVETERGQMAMDFGWDLDRYHKFRPMDDVEAVAHFYNNQGYEIVDQAGRHGATVDWAKAARSFTVATEVMPDFPRAWNNLGIAEARLDHRDEAIAAYRTAMRHRADFVAPYLNLGALQLRDGDLDAALASFDKAVELDPKNPWAQFNRGVALLRRGDEPAAKKALERAIQLQGDFAPARSLLDRIQNGGAGKEGVGGPGG